MTFCMPRIPTRTLLSLGAALFLLSACGDGPTAEERLAKATELREQGDLSAATLELKNALRDDGNLGEARFMLGEIYNDLGDGVSAEKELETARTLGVRDARLEVPLARAWVLQGNYQKVLDEVPLDSNATSERKIAVLIARAQSYYGLGQTVQAEKAYDAALSESPDNVDALVGLVRVAMLEDDLDKAEKNLSRATAVASDDFSVLAVKGDLEIARKDYEAGKEAFTQALELRPNNIGAHIGLAQAYIGLGDYEGAVPLIEVGLKQARNFEFPNYLRAFIAFQLKDYETAKKYAETAIKIAPGYLPSYLIAGGASYAIGQYEQANLYLERFLADNPTSSARRLLGAVQLRLNRPQEAMETLGPLAESSPDDEGLLQLVGMAAVQSGDLQSGTQYLRRALDLKPDDAATRARVGLLQIALGQPDTGIADLEKAVQEDTSLQSEEAALIAGYLRSRQFEKALEAAQRYQERNPQEAVGYTLAGLAHLGLDQEAEGRASFEKALEIAPGDPDASNNLAQLAIRNEQYAEAREFYRAVIEKHPRDSTTYRRLAALEAQLGDRDAARRWLEQAVEADPRAILPALELARSYVEAGQNERALSVARRALDQSPPQSARSALLEVVGRAQMAMGDFSQAVLTYSELSTLAPNSVTARYDLARAALADNNVSRARDALDAVLEMDPNHRGAKIARTRIALGQGDDETAKRLMAELASDEANTAILAEFEGALAVREDRPDDAVAAFQKLVELRNSSQDVLRLVDLQWQLDRKEDALASVRSWLEQHPNDQVVRFRLGQLLDELQRWQEAADAYSDIVKAVPDSVPTRNNLAWALLQSGNADAAAEHAQHAYELAPSESNVLDTYGLIELERGKADHALDLLKRASGFAPDNLSIQFHLAQAYIAQGDKESARALLRDLTSDGGDFPEKQAAADLYAELTE